jgi:lysophospholipase L1-like esterase
MAVRASIGGTRLQVRISNAFGGTPVTLGAAHIALRATESSITSGSDHALTFLGKPGCTIQPGVVVTSDPVNMTVAPLADLSVSLFFPGETGPPTSHGTGLHYTYIKEGDQTAASSMPDAQRTTQYHFLAGIDVMAPPSASALVTFGDSITDGSQSTVETNHNWPSLLAARLAASKAPIGVANVGIGGNRVLRDGAGASALARFDRDVLSQPGVKYLMVLEGINDIGHGAAGGDGDLITIEELIGAHKRIIEMAHAHGIKAIGCTLTPFEGAAYSREAGEVLRSALNQWIRSSGAYDGVADFDAATRDSKNSKHIKPDYDPGDHLHPNNAGYEAMANSVDLGIFGAKSVTPQK